MRTSQALSTSTDIANIAVSLFSQFNNAIHEQNLMSRIYKLSNIINQYHQALLKRNNDVAILQAKIEELERHLEIANALID